MEHFAPPSRTFHCKPDSRRYALKGNVLCILESCEVSGVNTIRTTLVTVLFSTFLLAQNPPTPPVQRQVQGQTILSSELPAADLTFDKDFRYVGAQVVNLYGNVDAEQHLFVKAAASGPVQSFYWVQFEHFLPTNKYTYDYKLSGTTDIGGLQFVYDVKSFLGYDAALLSDPQSDGAAISRLLAQHDLAFPKRAARVRMFYLPTPDRRTELMIIYGESLPDDSKIPVAKDGVLLDNTSPEAAKTLLDHARHGLTIRRH
jgi:hypothetical protein